ncbi:UNVERIFIED_CONTAM: hypothetical protein FKN15_044042 [Acipenser sinensis]
MHPTGGFSEGPVPGVWREISVCGNVYALRETRSAQQRGKLVRRQRAARVQQAQPIEQTESERHSISEQG